MYKFNTVTAALLAAACLFQSNSGWSQAAVVDSNNRLINTPSTRVPSLPKSNTVTNTTSPANTSSEMFYQMQVLQQEVQALRGQVEEQAYELKRLKQQRLDDYISFDRRLSALSGGNGTAAPSAPGAEENENEQAAPSPQSEPPQADEVQSYRTAIDLVLRQKDYAQAIVSFKRYLTDFPQGRYAPNSQYWLGEIYLLQSNLEQAREWFTRLLNENPEHSKAPDATYKLGTVYDRLGDKGKARQLLQQVANGDTNAARLASAYLADMDR